jgi:stalled ribosome rescue protein Dom34
MTLDTAIALIRKGACSGEKRDECATCAAIDEAMRALVREGARVAYGAGAVSDAAVLDAIAREVVS